MNYKNVTIAGSGVLGSQIAYQTAFHGYNVSIYDINAEAIDKAKEHVKELGLAFQKDLNATLEQISETATRISYFTDLSEAVKDADLVIEAIPENIKIKTEFYKQLSQVAPEKTIFATNTSSLLPSQFAEATGRPSQFLALHFANEIRTHNTAEIMGHATTDKAIFKHVVLFAESIGMIALPLYKEQPGYLLNSLLMPFLAAATDLLVNEVADAATIDKTWMIATGAPTGPFGILDIVGITTAYNINKLKAKEGEDPSRFHAANYLKENYIDKNKLGVSTGEGFYTYPNPEYLDPDFLK